MIGHGEKPLHMTGHGVSYTWYKRIYTKYTAEYTKYRAKYAKYEEQHDDRDADPCPPEDEECYDAPDAASMEESASLWKAWRHRNVVDLMTSTDSSKACLCP
jgi:uncharacterized lipoprotein YddW (UPF0748 family)